MEKQHVVIDMLEHELSEAQKVLKFPPEWRTLEGVDLAGMVPSGKMASPCPHPARLGAE